ncbi:MAG: hypothetical protein ACXAES_16700 [Promethearchaeota archaeon]|jgi:hypothetical protein
MFFQPAGPSLYPESPHSYIADSLLWIVLILSVVFAFFLLVEYLNTKQKHHVLWAMSFIATFILYHLVANNGTLGVALNSLTAGFTVAIPGLIAAGLMYAIWGREKKLLDRWSFAGLYLLGVCVMFVIVSILSLGNIQDAILKAHLDLNPTATITNIAFVPVILIMIFNIGNSVAIIGISIYSTVKTKETSRAAWLMAIGGILYVIAGIFLALIIAELDDAILAYFKNTIVYFIAGGSILYAFGMLYEEKWRFNIPGIEFEER